jgi:hypothetical protein
MDALIPARFADRWILRSPLAAFCVAAGVLTALWAAAGPHPVSQISGDAPFYVAMWRDPSESTSPPYTYRVLTPWLVRLTGLDAFWGFALVSIVSLALTAALLWAVVMPGYGLGHAWLALGLFVFSPAAVFSVADHYRVDALAYAFLAAVLLLLHRNRLTFAAIMCVCGLLAKEPVLFAAPIVLWLAWRARAWAAVTVLVVGAPSLYLVLHRTDLIAHGAGREFPYFTAQNLESVVDHQGGVVRAMLVAVVVGFGPLAVAAALGWGTAGRLEHLWALLLIPFTLSVVVAGDWIRMLAYAAIVFVPLAAAYPWSRAGAVLTLGATAMSATAVQKMHGSWPQVLVGAVIIAVYAALVRQPRFSTPPIGRRRLAWRMKEAVQPGGSGG